MEKAFAAYPRNKESKDILVPRSTKTQKSTDDIASYLVDKFRSPDYRPIFLKIAWRLDMVTIGKHVEASFGIDKDGKPIMNHRAYFIKAAKSDPSYR